MLLKVLDNLDKGAIWAGQPLLEPSERRLEALTGYGVLAGVIAIPTFVGVAIVSLAVGSGGAFLRAVPIAVAIAIVLSFIAYLTSPRLDMGGFELVEPDAYFVSRLEGLLEGLGAVVGVEDVGFAMVDFAGVNVGSFYKGRNRPVIVFTRGAQDVFSRVELEAVVARELARIKAGAALFDARLALLRRIVMSVSGGALPKSLSVHAAERVGIADVTGVSVTRYPPALAQVLERFGTLATGEMVPRYMRYSASAWLFPALGGASLQARIQELRTL